MVQWCPGLKSTVLVSENWPYKRADLISVYIYGVVWLKRGGSIKKWAYNQRPSIRGPYKQGPLISARTYIKWNKREAFVSPWCINVAYRARLATCQCPSDMVSIDSTPKVSQHLREHLGPPTDKIIIFDEYMKKRFHKKRKKILNICRNEVHEKIAGTWVCIDTNFCQILCTLCRLNEAMRPKDRQIAFVVSHSIYMWVMEWSLIQFNRGSSCLCFILPREISRWQNPTCPSKMRRPTCRKLDGIVRNRPRILVWVRVGGASAQPKLLGSIAGGTGSSCRPCRGLTTFSRPSSFSLAIFHF